MTCYLLVYDHLSLQIIQMDISNVSLCSQRYVLCMRKPTRFFPIYQRGDLQYPSFFHPSRSRVPSPSTRRTRWWFAIWVVFLRACNFFQKNETEEFFTLHHHKPPSFLFFFWGGANKKQWKFGNRIQALSIPRHDQRRPWRRHISIHRSLARFLPQLFAAAMAVEKTDAAVDVADAMVKAVRQAVETTLQKLG